MLRTKFVFHENWYIVPFTYVNKHILKKHKCKFQAGFFSRGEDGCVSLICWTTKDCFLCIGNLRRQTALTCFPLQFPTAKKGVAEENG